MNQSGERGKKFDSKTDKDDKKKNRNKDSVKRRRSLPKKTFVPQVWC